MIGRLTKAEMETWTIESENARLLQALFASDEKLLRLLEQKLMVQITTRDAWLKIEGDSLPVAKARKMFEELEIARKHGLLIRQQEFVYAMNAAAKDTPLDLLQLLETRIQCSKHKPAIIARTNGQKAYIHAIRNHALTLGLGPAGTGKTYLAVAAAVESLKQGKIKRIVLTRPAVEAGEALGFLPGDLTEKILPYLRPLYDALNDMLEAEEVRKYVELGIIEIAPLAYMRGRTLSSSFVILDEAQNTTTEQMFMFLTRLGADSKAVVTGDSSQIDLPKNKWSGLIEAEETLQEIKDIAFHYFEEIDVVRHPLVQEIIRAYRHHRGTQNYHS